MKTNKPIPNSFDYYNKHWKLNKNEALLKIQKDFPFKNSKGVISLLLIADDVVRPQDFCNDLEVINGYNLYSKTISNSTLTVNAEKIIFARDFEQEYTSLLNFLRTHPCKSMGFTFGKVL